MTRPKLPVRIARWMSSFMLSFGVGEIVYSSYYIISWNVKEYSREHDHRYQYIHISEHNLFDKLWAQKFLKTSSHSSDNPAVKFLKLVDGEVVPAAFLTHVGIAGIVIGFCLIVLACFGVKVPSTNKAYIFAYLNFILLLLAIFAKIYTSKESFIARSMKDAADKYYGAGDSSPLGQAWNILMVKRQCCGVKDYRDWVKKSQWMHPIEYYDYRRLQDIANISRNEARSFAESLSSEGCTATNKGIKCEWMDIERFTTPIACCKNIMDVFQGCHLKGTANSTNNNMDYGCLEALFSLWFKIYGHYSIKMIFGFSIGFLLIFCIVLSVVLVEFDSRENDENHLQFKFSSMSNIDTEMLIQSIEEGDEETKPTPEDRTHSVDLHSKEAVLFITQGTQTESSVLSTLTRVFRNPQGKVSL